MNQKLSIGMFFGGLGTFLMSLGEFFSSHPDWHSMSTPVEVAHIMVITGSFCITIAGALGINLPRNKNTRVDDRLSSKDMVNTIVKEEKKDNAKN
jgi:hypothetical protein